MLEFRLLGTVQATGDDGRALSIGHGKERALLAYLLLHRNAAVPREALIDALWADDPPASAAHALDVYVSRVRKGLGVDGVLETQRGALRLNVADEALDVARFERLLSEARSANDPSARLALVEQALALWRGRALADVLEEPFARPESERLEEERLVAGEEQLDALLALGRHDEAVGPLQALVAAEPLRERPRRLLMLALYRAGRQAEALAVFSEARKTLRDELGLEPSTELRELQAAILRQDDLLAAPPRRLLGAAEPTRPRPALSRRGGLIVLAAVAVAAGSAAAALLLGGGSGGLRSLPAEAAGLLDPRSGRIDWAVLAGSRPTALATGFGSTWVANEGDGTVSRVDPRREAVVQTIGVGRAPVGVAVGGGAVWVADEGDGTVDRIDPRLNSVGQRIPVGNGPGPIAFGAGAVWVANTLDASISRIDPGTDNVLATIPLSGTPGGIAVGAGGVWVTDSDNGTVTLIDPHQGIATALVPVGHAPAGVAVGRGSVWVANSLDGTVSRIDPTTTTVTGVVSVGGAPRAIAIARGNVWVADATGALVEIDARTATVLRRVPAGSSPIAVAGGADGLWTATAAALASHRGGTLRLMGYLDTTVDPALSGTSSSGDAVRMTNDALVNFDHRATGVRPSVLVPDLAESVPRPTDSGRTYTFRLRELRYSNGELLRPSDVRASLERLYRIGPASSYAQGGIDGVRLGIVGEAACVKRPRTCDLSRGVAIDNVARTVVFHLVRRNPWFLDLLAGWLNFVVLPASTPDRKVNSFPATGPYRIESFLPLKRLVLVRNPRFRQWSAVAQPAGFPDRIVWTNQKNNVEGINAVAAGRVDLSESVVPPSVERRVEQTSAQQLHADPTPFSSYMALNTRIAPFNRLDARRAFDYAIDRVEVASIFSNPYYLRPSCNLLPAGSPGYRPYCPYTLRPGRNGAWSAPDVVTTLRFVARSGTRGAQIKVVLPSDRLFARPLGRYLAHVLASLGWRPAVSFRPIDDHGPAGLLGYEGDSRHRVQLAWGAWAADVPLASAFLKPIVSCRSFVPANAGNLNLAEFCDPALDRLMTRAQQLEAGDLGAANRLWQQIEHRVIDEAPVVPTGSQFVLNYTSRRLRNWQWWPDIQAGIEDQWWVR
jgi:YVTN family beta-propeller protein